MTPFDVEIDWPLFYAALAEVSAGDAHQVVRKAALPWQYVGVIRRRRPLRRNPAAFLKMCRAFELDPLSFLADTTLWRAAQRVMVPPPPRRRHARAMRPPLS